MWLALFLGSLYFLHFLSNQTCKTHSNLQIRPKPNNHKNTKTQHVNQNTKTSLLNPTNQTPNIKTQPNTTIDQENPPPIHHLQTPPMAKKSRSTHNLWAQLTTAATQTHKTQPTPLISTSTKLSLSFSTIDLHRHPDP